MAHSTLDTEEGIRIIIIIMGEAIAEATAEAMEEAMAEALVAATMVARVSTTDDLRATSMTTKG